VDVAQVALQRHGARAALALGQLRHGCSFEGLGVTVGGLLVSGGGQFCRCNKVGHDSRQGKFICDRTEGPGARPPSAGRRGGGSDTAALGWAGGPPPAPPPPPPSPPRPRRASFTCNSTTAGNPPRAGCRMTTSTPSTTTGCTTSSPSSVSPFAKPTTQSNPGQ